MTYTAETTDEIKNMILDIAVDRFGHYGFGKTTMAEISRDCDMSAGNLYRYFKNKLEIGASCAQRFISRTEKLLREVLRRPDLTPSMRLEALVLENLRFTVDQISSQPRIHELVTYIYDERQDMVQRHLEFQHSLYAEVLEEGNRTGEFDLHDVLATARLVYSASTKFHDPYWVKSMPLDALEKEAIGVIDLLMNGLRRKK